MFISAATMFLIKRSIVIGAASIISTIANRTLPGAVGGRTATARERKFVDSKSCGDPSR
jgi:hypothetical protein